MPELADIYLSCDTPPGSSETLKYNLVPQDYPLFKAMKRKTDIALWRYSTRKPLIWQPISADSLYSGRFLVLVDSNPDCGKPRETLITLRHKTLHPGTLGIRVLGTFYCQDMLSEPQYRKAYMFPSREKLQDAVCDILVAFADLGIWPKSPAMGNIIRGKITTFA